MTAPEQGPSGKGGDNDDGGLQESFFSHLIELRSRLLRAAIAVGVALLALFPFRNTLFDMLAAPLMARLPTNQNMIATGVLSSFMTPLESAFYAALFISMPVVLYQLWAFISPGLYRHEKRLTRPLLIAAVVLFYLGCAFAYFLVFPVAFRVLVAIGPHDVHVMPDIAQYLDFILVTFFVFGLAFEVPVVVVILAALGVVSLEQLRGGRRYAIVGAFAIAAFVPSPDPISMLLMGIPMCLLYELGLLAVRWLVKKTHPAANP